MTSTAFQEPDWTTWVPTVRATLMFIRDGGRVLLIRKKRGIGAGKINGPGGKIDPGESEATCAIRETQEELGVTAIDPRRMGELSFEFADGMRMHVAVFMASAHSGDAYETDEAIPLWTPIDSIPFDQMWADDAHWLHRMLTDELTFRGHFCFDGDTMLTHRVEWTE
ncbi:hypothetical protein BH23VER1_BH23VER1_33400 [soil metagenome]